MVDDAPGKLADSEPQAAEQVSDSPDKGKEQPEAYAGTYMDKEAADKGIAESQAQISELKSAQDKLKNEHAAELAKVTSERVSMLEQIQKVKDASQKPSISRQQYVTDLAQRFRDAEDGSNEQAVAMQELADGNMQYTESLLAEQKKASDERYEQLAKSVAVVTQNTSPEYLAHKDSVDVLMGKGLKFPEALIAAKELATVKQPDQQVPMNGTTGNRVAAQEDKGKMSDARKEAIREMYKNDMKPEQIENIIASMEEKDNG